MPLSLAARRVHRYFPRAVVSLISQKSNSAMSRCFSWEQHFLALVGTDPFMTAPSFPIVKMRNPPVMC